MGAVVVCYSGKLFNAQLPSAEVGEGGRDGSGVVGVVDGGEGKGGGLGGEGPLPLLHYKDAIKIILIHLYYALRLAAILLFLELWRVKSRSSVYRSVRHL